MDIRLFAAEYFDHIRKPPQFTGKAFSQLCRIFTALANIKETVSTVNSNIQSAVRFEIHGEFTDGRTCQRQNPLHPVGGQNTECHLFIIAAQIESFVKVLIPRSEERRVGKECRSRWSPYH